MILLLMPLSSYKRASIRLRNAGYAVAPYQTDLEQLRDTVQTQGIAVAVVYHTVAFAADAKVLLQRVQIPIIPFELDYDVLLNQVAAYHVAVIHTPESASPVTRAPVVVTTELHVAPGDIEKAPKKGDPSEPQPLRVSQLLRPAPTPPAPVIEPKISTTKDHAPTPTAERIVEVPVERIVEVPVEKIVEVERIVHVDRPVEVAVQTGIAQRLIVVASAFARSGVTLTTLLAAQLVARARVRVAVIEAPGITPSLVDLLDVRTQATGRDWRQAKPIQPIEMGGVSWYPLYQDHTDADPEEQIDILLRLIYRLRDYPLVLLDTGSQFYNEEIFEIADRVWWVVEPDPIRLARMLGQPQTPEYEAAQRIKELPTRRVQTIVNRSSVIVQRERELFAGAIHLPQLPHDELQQAQWNVQSPLDTDIRDSIMRAWRPLIEQWVTVAEEKKQSWGWPWRKKIT